jgi:hypothetical protein
MRSAAQLQWCASVHGVVQNLFRVVGIYCRRLTTGLLRAGVRRKGCGDVRLLNEREAPTSRERGAQFAPKLTMPPRRL